MAFHAFELALDAIRRPHEPLATISRRDPGRRVRALIVHPTEGAAIPLE